MAKILCISLPTPNPFHSSSLRLAGNRMVGESGSLPFPQTNVNEGGHVAELLSRWPAPRLQLDTIANKNPQTIWITFRHFSILSAMAMLALTELLGEPVFDL